MKSQSQYLVVAAALRASTKALIEQICTACVRKRDLIQARLYFKAACLDNNSSIDRLKRN